MSINIFDSVRECSAIISSDSFCPCVPLLSLGSHGVGGVLGAHVSFSLLFTLHSPDSRLRQLVSMVTLLRVQIC